MNNSHNLTVRLLLSLLTIVAITLGADAKTSHLDSMLNRLDDVLDRRDTYYVLHEYKIDSLLNIANRIPREDHSALANAYHQVFRAYSSFQGDSALNFANREYDAALKSGKPDDIVRAKTDLVFTHLSSGNFTDGVEIANHMDLSQASPERKTEWYYLCIRLFSDLSNYLVADFNDKNALLSGAYCDSVMQIALRDSYAYQYALAFNQKNKLPNEQKTAIFHKLLERNDIDLGTKAMIASILGDFYGTAGNQDKYIDYKIESAILDVESAKRETVSKLDLGKWLFDNGDVDRAHRYIDLAKEDAEFYNARNRKFQIMSILPLVEKARYTNVDTKRSHLQITVIIIGLLALALIAAIFYIFRQLKEVRAARRETEERNSELKKLNGEIEERNREIQEKNTELHNMLGKLRESNKIKDEYIGYGFYVHAEYIRKLESLYNMVDRKLMTRQYDELQKSLKRGDIRKEKENMHESFDRIFLRLFPDFIAEYKKLFPKDDPKNAESNGHTLTSEMRIFALIRLGITDIGNIALFLNYSVNTVNTYKTKAKNRSLLANEDFEPAIMQIKST